MQLLFIYRLFMFHITQLKILSVVHTFHCHATVCKSCCVLRKLQQMTTDSVACLSLSAFPSCDELSLVHFPRFFKCQKWRLNAGDEELRHALFFAGIMVFKLQSHLIVSSLAFVIIILLILCDWHWLLKWLDAFCNIYIVI